MTTETTAVALRETALAAQEMSVEMVLAQTKKIQELMQVALIDGEHYGAIPGTGQKKTLLKPGAEKLCLMFRFSPEYSHDTEREPTGHLTVNSTCRLIHSPSGTLVATGSGMCSTHESKYAYRKAQRLCPNCGEPKIIKSKYPNRATGNIDWYCLACKQSWEPTDQAIVGQEQGRAANADLPDQWNTVLKMADKRALVAAVLNGTAASDIFTQDLEDLEENLKARKPPSGPEQDGVDAGGVQRQKPSDKASPEQRMKLMELADRTLGKDEAKAWIGERMRKRPEDGGLGRAKWGDVTIGDIQVLTKELMEFSATNQEPPPDDDDENVKSFEKAQAGK